jgi:hypothetical protein
MLFWIDIGLILLCTFLFLLSSTYPTMAGTFPRIVLIMVMIVTIADLIKTICKRRSPALGDATQEEKIDSRHPWKVLYMAFLMFIFFLLLNLFGVIIGTLLFLLLSGWTLGYKKPKKLILSSVIISASVYLIFEVVMSSFLPKGAIFSIVGG